MEFHPVVENQAVPADPKVRIPLTDADREYVKALKFLTEEQVKFFRDTGCLIIPREQMWTEEEFKTAMDSVNLMDSWPDQRGKWMKYYEVIKKEDGTDAKILQRMENFVDYNEGINSILNGDKMVGMCSQLFDEPSILYKEKINYKLPGGSGFAPHQDVSAGWWMYGQTLHISVLICVDEATPENGCLEVVYGKHKDGLLGPEWKEVPADVVDQLEWITVPTKPGDIIFFDSFVPHRSGPNTTNKPRRMLYATYAKKSEGDFRAKYYEDKRISFPPDIERDENRDYAYKI